MRLDLHVHTYHSDDSLMTLAEIVEWVHRRGLDGLAITDHDSIAGALELRAVAPFPVIVGEEVKTTEGELIGLFLTELVSRGLSPEETIAAIRAQGGVVYVPHPFDRLRRSALSVPALERIAGLVDALEVINARDFFSRDSWLARDYARTHGLAMGAGSDAHLGCEIGNAVVEVAPFDGASSFLAALRQGQFTGHLTTPLVHVVTSSIKACRRLRSRRSRR